MPGYRHPLGTVAELSSADLADLEEDLRGEVTLPDHEEYDDARTLWNGLVNRYPALIVRAAGAVDVATAVAFAREHDLELAVRGGAHNQTGAAMVDNGVVIDLEEIDGISVDVGARAARIGPGNRVEDVLAETQAYGLAPPTGSAGGVGIAGPTLGGGIGWTRRKHGLSVDALRSVEIVTAAGDLLRAAPDQHPDLYWAVRGGGGNFGIVTEFEFDLFEVGPIVGGLGVFYPSEASRAVLETHSQFMAEAPEELSTILIHGHVPALPAIPEEVHGEGAIAILGCYAGDPEAGMDVLAPLRDIAEPIIDMSEPMPYEVLHDLGKQMYPWGRNYVHRSVFLDDLDDDVNELIDSRAKEAPGAMDVLAIWALGGNIGHGTPSAFPWSEKRYMVTIEANWEHYQNEREFEWAHETERLLRDLGGEGAYGGFTGVEEQPWEDWSAQVYADNYERLAAVKAEYDPDNVFEHNVNVTPT